jgi:hypothetical protein
MRTVLQRSWRLRFLSMKETLRHSERNWSVNYATRLLPEKAKQQSEGWDQTLSANSDSNIPLRHARNSLPVWRNVTVWYRPYLEGTNTQYAYTVYLKPDHDWEIWMEKLGGSKTTDESILKVPDDYCKSSLIIWQRDPTALKYISVHTSACSVSQMTSMQKQWSFWKTDNGCDENGVRFVRPSETRHRGFLQDKTLRTSNKIKYGIRPYTANPQYCTFQFRPSLIFLHFGRSCDRPPRHRFFLVSLCL